MKITTKMWLAKVVAIFTHRTCLLHRIRHIGLFYSKTKIGHNFSLHSFFVVFILTFNKHVCMIYLFCVVKNNGNNVRRTTEGEKSNKCCARSHTIIFFSLRGTAQKYLFHSYQSLHF